MVHGYIIAEAIMPTENTPEELAKAWIEGWIAGKPEDIPLAEEFTHSSPFGVVSGRTKYLEWVKPLSAKNVNSLKIIRTLGGENEAAIWFEMQTPKGLVLCCDWLHTKEGKIISIQSFYDATSLRE